MNAARTRWTFISYSRKDKEFALELGRALKSAGHFVWLDQLDIPTGSRWDDEVERALRECEIFLVILTVASISSENVKDEIGYAIDHRKRIIPVLLEECEIPLRLRRFQYVDFTRLKFDEGVQRAKQLLEDSLNSQPIPVTQKTLPELKARSKAEVGTASSLSAPKTPAADRSSRRAAGIVAFTVTVFVLLAAYLGYLGIRSQIEFSIHATQTAEAKLFTLSPTSVPTVIVPTITATITISQPSPTPSPVPTLLPVRQEVQWIPDNDGNGTAGLCINEWSQTSSGPICPNSSNFVSWNVVNNEFQQQILPFVPNVPPGSTLRLKNGPNGEINWIIQVIGPNGNEIANVWIGNDPLNSWRYDGLIRIGYPYNPVNIWATFARFSDNSYKEE